MPVIFDKECDRCQESLAAMVCELRKRQPDPDFIADLRDFLQDHADAEYLPADARPRPNQAMRLLTRLDEIFPEGE